MKTTMKIVCMPMMTKLAHDTDTMPTMLRIVTIAIDTMIHTHCGTAGIASPM